MQQSSEFDSDSEFNQLKIDSVSWRSKPVRVMIVEDDESLRVALERYFQLWGFTPSTFADAESLLNYFKNGGNPKSKLPKLIVSDLMLPNKNGIQLVQGLKELDLNIPVVITTAHGSLDSAARALAEGAFDYITKPLNFADLKVVCERALRHMEIDSHQRELQRRHVSMSKFGALIGSSKKMKDLFELLERVSTSIANVLVTGESGTGKELVARTLHEKSTRAKRPFVAINCSAIPAELLEAELFGYRKGAFTGAFQNRRGLFEEANSGTIFLDEIGDMPMPLQCKLLRVIQERKIRPVGGTNDIDLDVRIIAATNKDLVSEIKKEKFREDLFYRLCVIHVSIPPLRERLDDIPLLCDHFLLKYAAQISPQRAPIKGFSQAALDWLMCRTWRGNVRELENTIERAVVLCQKQYIEEDDLVMLPIEDETSVLGNFKELLSLDQLERQYIEFVLSKTGGHKERAAHILGIDRKTLRRKILH